MAIDMVGFPIRNGGSFHSCVSLPEDILLLPNLQCFQNRLIHLATNQIHHNPAWFCATKISKPKVIGAVIQYGHELLAAQRLKPQRFCNVGPPEVANLVYSYNN